MGNARAVARAPPSSRRSRISLPSCEASSRRWWCVGRPRAQLGSAAATAAASEK